MVEIKVYRFSTNRDKESFSLPTYRERMLKKLREFKCDGCTQLHPRSHAELDHKIPIMCGGERFNPDNMHFLCVQCHMKKTIIDKVVINYFKNFYYLSHVGWIVESLLSKSELRQEYLRLFKFRSTILDYHQDWTDKYKKEVIDE